MASVTTTEQTADGFVIERITLDATSKLATTRYAAVCGVCGERSDGWTDAYGASDAGQRHAATHNV